MSDRRLFDLVSTPLENDSKPKEKPPPPDTVIVVDGKLSVEHQLDIHVNDLLQVDLHNGPSYADILSGIRYVMDYRIRNGRLLHLDYEICARLVQAFLRYTNLRTRPYGSSFFHGKKLTKEADIAFELFNDFLEEVYEFREAVGEVPLDELRRKLLFYSRLAHPLSPEEFEVAVSLLRNITRTFPQFREWSDFFKEEDWATVDKALAASSFYDEGRKASLKPIVCYPPQSLYFDREVNRVLDMFQTSAEEGLSQVQMKFHRDYYGFNILPAPQAKSVARMILDQLSDFMIIVLICTMIVSAIMDFPKITSAAVLAVVIISNVIIGFWQEWKAAKTVKALRSMTVPRARVIRGGAEDVVDASELVPGDVVILAEGDFVPADLRLIKVNRLELVECNLTGESEPVPKNSLAIRVKSRKLPITKCHANAFMSTMVARGSGVGVVVRVGEATEIGKINAALAEEASLSPAEAKSPLQRKLSKLGFFLVILAVGLSIIVAVAGIAWGKSFKKMLPVAISLAVSVIPEGLVAVVTVTMAIGVSRLAEQHAIVRKMPAVETLGAVTTICSDKTGTLTEGRMRVRTMKSVAAFLNPGKGTPGTEKIPWLVSALCNNAALSLHTDGTTEFTGDSTEIALIEAGQSAIENLKLLPFSARLIEIPFDSDRKMMSVVLPVTACESMKLFVEAFASKEEPLAFVLTKGAPEVLFAKCTSYIEGGKIEVADDAFSEKIANEVDNMSGTGLRVLSLAVKPIYDVKLLDRIRMFELDPEAEPDTLYKDIEADLTLVGIVGLLDPPRLGVSKSIQDCFNAGIKVCMITGDHLRTAISIAKELNIFDQNDPQRCRAMRGDDLDVLSDEAIASMNPFPVVFARVSPQNKLSIVRALQSRGEIVIMTGDGVNDAPAISKANVGIAMGQSGTEISKDAADVILLDDNFFTILKAVHGGRLIYSNILKFLVYLLACNSAEIWTVLVAALVNVPVPLSAINILWANIIADVPPSMSLGMEPAEEGLLEQKPRNIRSGVLSLRNWLLILLEGVLLSSAALGLYFWNYYHLTKPISDLADPVLVELRSEAFFILTGLQLVLALFSRSTKASAFTTGFFGNKYLLGAVALSFGLLLMGHYTPGLNEVLELRPIDSPTWIFFGAASCFLLIGTEIVKFFLRLSF